VQLEKSTKKLEARQQNLHTWEKQATAALVKVSNLRGKLAPRRFGALEMLVSAPIAYSIVWNVYWMADSFCKKEKQRAGSTAASHRNVQAS